MENSFIVFKTDFTCYSLIVVFTLIYVNMLLSYGVRCHSFNNFNTSYTNFRDVWKLAFIFSAFYLNYR